MRNYVGTCTCDFKYMCGLTHLAMFNTVVCVDIDRRLRSSPRSYYPLVLNGIAPWSGGRYYGVRLPIRYVERGVMATPLITSYDKTRKAEPRSDVIPRSLGLERRLVRTLRTALHSKHWSAHAYLYLVPNGFFMYAVFIINLSYYTMGVLCVFWWGTDRCGEVSRGTLVKIHAGNPWPYTAVTVVQTTTMAT